MFYREKERVSVFEGEREREREKILVNAHFTNPKLKKKKRINEL